MSIDSILADRRGSQNTRPLLGPRTKEQVVPLSFAQQPPWLLEKLEPGNPTNHLATAFRLRGKLDRAALNRSFDEIVRRHEVLRTTFPEVNGEPIASVGPPIRVAISETGIQGTTEFERDADVQRNATEEVRRPFDLTHGPLIRVSLFRRAKDDHVLLITLHRLVGDGLSMRRLCRELGALYEAFTMGKPCPLAKPEVQYGDFALWQRRRLQGPILESQLSYWNEQLGGDLPTVDLPLDRPRPAVQTYRGARHPIDVSPAMHQALRSLGQQENSSLFMVLLAALQTLTHRYTGQPDIVVGAPMAARDTAEVAGLIGPLLHPLPLRTAISPDLSFREVLSRVRRVAREAYANQDVPFDRIVEQVQPRRDSRRNPIFQIMFQLSEAASLHLPGLTVCGQMIDPNTSQFDLAFCLCETKEGVAGYIEYNTSLFEAATIGRLAGHFQALLASVVEDPDRPVAQLRLLTEAELHQLLIEWNDTGAEYPRESSIHELIEARVRQTPHAIAAVFEQQQLTYRELDDRANQLARYLQHHGVEPDALVGICADRSLEMLVAVLGVLKAGGAYVPLDPTFPRERLDFMVEDSGIAVLITQQRLADDFADYRGSVVCMDRDWDRISLENTAAPPSRLTADHLAYVIYTSGSTGRPKGVQIPHRAAVNLLLSMARMPGLTAEDVSLAVITLSFDMAVPELLLPLVCGARIVIASREDTVDGARLLRLISDHGVTMMQATPATWHLLLEAGWRAPNRLKMLCAGEALPRQLANRLLDRGASLWNMYGPTETTVYSAGKRIESKEGPVLFGPLIANTQLYILDEHLNVMPIGVPGELHIGGDGLARGYLNRPELTTAKFIDNPFDDRPGSRMYKSGDLVRYLPSGDIEFLGRIDHQVKVHGFRIELGEIESTLTLHPQVREAVVSAREVSPGDKRLVAYVICEEGQPFAASALRTHLRASLPEYMVPSHFVPLDAFPLTPSGKVNRRALPAPTGERQTSEAFVAPGNELEKQIAEIWKEVLGVDGAGVDDDFFELGGRSLLAVRLFSRMEQLTGKRLPLATLLEAPTIRALAQRLTEDESDARWSSLVEMQPGTSWPPVFAMHAAGGNILLYRDLARHLGPDQPFYGLQSQGLHGDGSHPKRIEDMAEHYVREIQKVQPHGPYLLTGYCMGGTIALEVAQQLSASGHKVAMVALLETYDWRKTKLVAMTFADGMRYFGQKVEFHWRNFWLLNFRDKKRFLAEKLRVARERRKIWQGILLSRVLGTSSRAGGDHRRLGQLWQLNHKSSLVYEANPYPGRITHFRPRKEYTAFGGAGLDAADGEEIHTLPVYPAGMLVEPFVAQLAARMKECIRRALGTGEEAASHE